MGFFTGLFVGYVMCLAYIGFNNDTIVNKKKLINGEPIEKSKKFYKCKEVKQVFIEAQNER